MRATKKSLKPSHHYGLMVQSIKKAPENHLVCLFLCSSRPRLCLQRTTSPKLLFISDQQLETLSCWIQG